LGVIIKESLNQSLIRVIVSFVGAIAFIFLYPLDTDLYGLFQYVLNTAALLIPFVVLGLGQAAIRFFPFAGDDKNSKQKFFWFVAKIFLFNIVLFTSVFFLTRNWIIKFSMNPSPEYSYYLNFIFFGALLFSTIDVIVRYISNYKIVAIPSLFQTLYKLFIPISFGLVYFKFISRESGIYLLWIVLCLSIFFLAWLLNKNYNKDIKASENSKEKKPSKSYTSKEFFNYYFWTFASSAGGLIAFRIDGYMVPALTTFELNGVYSMAMFTTFIILIPINAVINIAQPILSQAWKDQNIDSIKRIYLKGSENLIYIGVAMFLAILLLLDFIPIFFNYLAQLDFLSSYKSFGRLSDKWAELDYMKWLVLILGVSKLFDMASSVNGVIIQHSKWFKYNTFFIIIMMVVNVVLNYTLMVIVNLGITGAAIATTISLIMFNAMKTILLYQKIKVQPFTQTMMLFILTISLVVISIFTLSNYMPSHFALIVNAIITGITLYLWLFPLNYAEDTKKSLKGLKEKWLS